MSAIAQLEAELPEYLLCPICNSFLTDGGFINEHGNTYCGVCINSLNGKDPLCQRNFISIIPNRLASNFTSLLLSRKLIYSSSKEELTTPNPQKSLITFADVVSFFSGGNVLTLQSLTSADFAPDVHERDRDGNHLLHIIACNYPKHLSLLKYLPFTNMNVRDVKGRTPLHRAVKNHKSDLNELVSRGADVNGQDNKGRTPLHLVVKQACKYSDLESSKIGFLALKQFLAFRPDVNLSDGEGRRPLHCAVEGNYRQINICRLLLDNGADIDAVEKENGRTALILAAEQNKHIIFLMLLRRGAKINVQNNFKRISGALHCAVKNKNIRIAELLLNTPGCSLDARDFQGMTPLHEACSGGLLAMVELLVQSGADMRAEADILFVCCDKADAFHFALQVSPRICQYLLDQGKYTREQLLRYIDCAFKISNWRQTIPMIEEKIKEVKLTNVTS